jgi:hypothetical protein
MRGLPPVNEKPDFFFSRHESVFADQREAPESPFFFSQRGFFMRRICRNRRIALLPSALWFLPVPFGVLNLLRVLPSPGSNLPPAHHKR